MAVILKIDSLNTESDLINITIDRPDSDETILLIDSIFLLLGDINNLSSL